MPEALLFDFDGLILDTEVPVYEAWRHNYEAHGYDLPLETYVQCVGSNFHRFDPKAHLDGLVDEEIDWSYWDTKREKTAYDLTLELAPFPGVVPLLEEARARAVPCVVASSSPRSWVEDHLGRLGLLPFFTATRCLDDVAAAKPAPDLFIAAAEIAGTNPAEALVLEDSRNGLIAAQRAGIDCIIVPNRITQGLDFDGASAVLETLEGVTLSKLDEIRARD